MTAYLVGILYALFGIVLLFFGARLMKLVLAVFGGLIGINAGQIAVIWWDLHGFWAFLIVLLCALAVGSLAVAFYKLFIAASIGYILAVIAYNLLLSWHTAHTLAILIGLAVGIAVSVVIDRLNLVEVAFKFITSVQGAIALASGLYLLFHTARLDTLQANQYDVLLGASIWWVIFWLVAFTTGFGYQLRTENRALTTI